MKRRFSIKLELWGHRFELAGLVVAIIAGFWQAQVSGWWSEQSPEWQYLIQNEVNYSVLSALGDLGMIFSGDDPELSREHGIRLHHEMVEAISRAMEMRDKRKIALQGEAAAASNTRFGLFVLGALLVLLGKYCHYRAVLDREKYANQ